MKQKILKSLVFNIGFLLFLIYALILLILTLSTIVVLSDGKTESYYYFAEIAFNIKISTLLVNVIQLLTVIFITAIFGYFAIKSLILLHKEYKSIYADKIATRKAERAEADTQKAIAKKQQQLERLQSKLEELKKD